MNVNVGSDADTSSAQFDGKQMPANDQNKQDPTADGRADQNLRGVGGWTEADSQKSRGQSG